MDRGQSDGESFNGSSCETSSEGEKSTDSFRFAVKSYRIVSHVTCENLRLPENVTINLFVDKLMENVFTDGVLLRALEKGVLHPVLHFSPKQYDIEDEALPTGLKVLKGGFVLHRALYDEIDSVTSPVIAQTTGLNSEQAASAYIVTGFRTFERNYNQVFEENWKDLSGARTIYLNLSSQFGLSKMSLLRRVKPDSTKTDLNNFAYILFVELTRVTERNKCILFDFIHRLRLRMLGYLAVYMDHKHHHLHQQISS